MSTLLWRIITVLAAVSATTVGVRLVGGFRKMAVDTRYISLITLAALAAVMFFGIRGWVL